MIALAVVGDVMIQRRVARSTVDLCRELAATGTLLGNLEMTLSRTGAAAAKLITIRGRPELVDELSRLGFDAMSLANNHVMDFGHEAMRETRQVLEDNGIATCGAGGDIKEARRARVVGAPDVAVAVIGVCAALPTGFAATADRPGVAPLHVVSKIVLDPPTLAETPGMSPYVETSAVVADVAAVCEEISHRRREGTAPIVVAVHWGVPPGWTAGTQGELAAYQQPVARQFVDAGADAVIGHHPHAIQGIEIYRRKPILYSVGNFIFQISDEDLSQPDGMYPAYRLETLRGIRNRFGAVAQLTFDRTGAVGLALRIVRLNARGEPSWANSRETRNCMQWLDPQGQSPPAFLRLETIEGRPVVVADMDVREES